MIDRSSGAVIASLFGVFLTLVPTGSRSDERCRQLDVLRVKYAGAELTLDQKALKVKLTAWYLANCGKHEVADTKAASVASSVR